MVACDGRLRCRWVVNKGLFVPDRARRPTRRKATRRGRQCQVLSLRVVWGAKRFFGRVLFKRVDAQQVALLTSFERPTRGGPMWLRIDKAEPLPPPPASVFVCMVLIGEVRFRGPGLAGGFLLRYVLYVKKSLIFSSVLPIFYRMWQSLGAAGSARYT